MEKVLLMGNYFIIKTADSFSKWTVTGKNAGAYLQSACDVCLFVALYCSFNAMLTAKIISWRSVRHLCVFWLSHTRTDISGLSKVRVSDDFCHIYQSPPCSLSG